MFTNLIQRRQNSNRHHSRSATSIEMLECRIAPAILVGLTTTDSLITFDSAAPTKILTIAKINGLPAGENIRSIDVRPANGVIYGLSADNNLYTLNPYSGLATAIGSSGDLLELGGTTASIDFNPAVDRLRVINSSDLNFRYNPATGAIVDGDAGTAGVQPDTQLTFDVNDVNKNKRPALGAIAYANNIQGATLTTLYAIDHTRNTLAMIGSINGTPSSPNSGIVTTIGALGKNVGPRLGFDIAADGTAYASMQVGATTSLFTINLSSGAATVIGKIGKGNIKLDSVAALPLDEVIVGVTTNNVLVSFRANDPSTILSAVALTGLALGETIRGIDFRPATGELFGITTLNQIITINRFTGQTIDRGAIIDTSFTASAAAGFDFNPTVDRIRLVNSSEDNLRYNPVTFAPVDIDGVTPGTQGDTNLAYIATDPNVGTNPNITGAAYDRNDNSGATATTLFGIDSTLNIVVRQGAVDGSPTDPAGGASPNGGLLTTLGALGVDPTDLVGFDISDNGALGVGAKLAVMQLNGETGSKLFSINTTSGLTNQPVGLATLIGAVGTTDPLVAMAIAPASIQFAVSNTLVKEKAGTSVAIEITRTGGSAIASTVNFSTSDGTALSGLDYTGVTNLVVTFAPGETMKVVMVQILGDRLVEFDEFFRFQLSGITGGGTTELGSNATAIATIIGKKLKP